MEAKAAPATPPTTATAKAPSSGGANWRNRRSATRQAASAVVLPTPPAEQVAVAVAEQPQKPQQTQTVVKAKYAQGASPCYVCGKDDHRWVVCPRKKTTGCGVCGVKHPTHTCSNRWRPAPKVQVAEVQQMAVEVREDVEARLPIRANAIKPPAQRKPEPEPLPDGDPLDQIGEVTALEVCSSGFTNLPPVNQPDLARLNRPPYQARYAMRLNGVKVVAMLDNGSMISAISTKMAERLGWTGQISQLHLSLRLFVGDPVQPECQLYHDVPIQITEGCSFVWDIPVVWDNKAKFVLGMDLMVKLRMQFDSVTYRLLFVHPETDECMILEPDPSSVIPSPTATVDEGQTNTEMWTQLVHEVPVIRPIEGVKMAPSAEAAEVSAMQLEKWVAKETLDPEYNMFCALMVQTSPGVDEDVSAIGTPIEPDDSEPALTEQEKERQYLDALPTRVREILEPHADLFRKPPGPPVSCPVEHDIITDPEAVPATSRVYPLPADKQLEAVEQITDLLERGLVKPSYSPWCSPIVFVKKKEGTWRMCVDYRNLNALTKKDGFPLPRMDLLLHRVASCSWFSKIDLTTGFHQIPLSYRAREKTAFRTPIPIKGGAHFEWVVMPFGLVNAPSSFQRLMWHVLQGLEDFAVVYIDDILVFSHDYEEHMGHLTTVMERLAKFKLFLKPSKCTFAQRKLEFLGHQVSADGVTVPPERRDAIRRWKPPFATAKQVRSFWGMVSWYSEYIPHAAEIGAPLIALMATKGKKFAWSEEATAAVYHLQDLLMSAPVLKPWYSDLEARVTTDASLVAIAAVLEQCHKDGWHPVAYWSRVLKPPERNYSATDREWLAVVQAVSRKWRHFLENKPFVLRSDHAALGAKLTKTQPEPPDNDRHARWITRMQGYPLDISIHSGIEEHSCGRTE